MNKILKEKIEKLKGKYLRKIHSFREKHVTYMDCFPDGVKVGFSKSAGVQTYLCTSYRSYIYICEAKCSNQCKDYLNKVYICKDLGCKNWPLCMQGSEKYKRKSCKKYNMKEERAELEKIYERFLLLNKIYRGLKINPEKTLRWLKKRKAKENGKIQFKSSRTKGQRIREGEKIKTKKNVKRKKFG